MSHGAEGTPPRYLQRQVEDDLQRKMVFLAGPRQVGKTTLARSLVVSERRRPILLVEAKLGDDARDASLRYLKSLYPSAEAWQVHAHGTKDYVTEEGIRVAPALELLRGLA